MGQHFLARAVGFAWYAGVLIVVGQIIGFGIAFVAGLCDAMHWPMETVGYGGFLICFFGVFLPFRAIQRFASLPTRRFPPTRSIAG
jgi:hypothetical protein